MKKHALALVVFLASLAAASAALAVTHVISQEGLSFNPANITIEVGDTVQWNWTGGSHTVTSGTNLADPDVGQLFDQALNSSNPSFSFTFNTTGTQDFFCRPHVNFGMTGSVTVTAPSPVGESPNPAAVRLLPNVPNPFNPSTRITFEIPDGPAPQMKVSLKVFDLRGRLARVLLDAEAAPGPHTVIWDGRDLHGSAAPSGLYVYRLDTPGRSVSRTMTLAK